MNPLTPHEFIYECSFIIDGYLATCRCGWRAETYRDRLVRAMADHADHVRGVAS